MKLKWLVLFPILLGGCAQPTPAKPASLYSVAISASAERISIGETVTVMGTITGAYEDPRYYVTVTDQTAPASEWKLTILPGNVIEGSAGESAVLELESTTLIADTLTVIFRARNAGTAAMVIGVVGKVGKMDGAGRWQYDYTSRYSDSAILEVR